VDFRGKWLYLIGLYPTLDVSTLHRACPIVIAVSEKQTDNPKSEDRASATAYKNVALHECTYARLTAFKNLHPLVDKSFDTALNDALDAIEFPQADEIESMYLPNVEFGSDNVSSVEE